MTDDVGDDTSLELYDYDVLRRLEDATMFAVYPLKPLLVLGGHQSAAVLNDRGHTWPIRRRRGGGGLVLLEPEDVWVDFWIPREDPRWREDVREASYVVGEWWASVLRTRDVDARVHRGGLETTSQWSVACFAGRGPGEVMVNDIKTVGLTQWRVREGSFVSTVLRSRSSEELAELVRSSPDGLAEALHHHSTSSLVLSDDDALMTDLRDVSGPWRFRQLALEL